MYRTPNRKRVPLMIKYVKRDLASRVDNGHALRVHRLMNRLKAYGNMFFSFAAATEWNSLLLYIKQAETVAVLKNVKTFFFKLYFRYQLLDCTLLQVYFIIDPFICLHLFYFSRCPCGSYLCVIMCMSYCVFCVCDVLM